MNYDKGLEWTNQDYTGIYWTIQDLTGLCRTFQDYTEPFKGLLNALFLIITKT